MFDKSLKDKTVGQFLLAGLLAGILAIAVNVIWHFLFQNVAVPEFELPESITTFHVIGASLIPLLLGSLVLFGISRGAKKPVIYWVILCLILVMFSLVGSFGSTLPDGTAAPAKFDLWSAPMHIVAGLSAAFIIPYWLSKDLDKE